MYKLLSFVDQVKNSSLISKGVACLSTLKTSILVLFLLAFVGIGFSSCNQNENEAVLHQEQMETLSSSQLRSSKQNSPEATGWSLIEDLGNEYGYKLYSKGSSFVQKVNLSAGGKIAAGFGKQSRNEENPSSPLFKRTSLSSFWRARPNKALSVINCAFFGYDEIDTSEAFAPLSFPFKLNGAIKSTGSYNSSSNKRILSLNTTDAIISPFEITVNAPSVIQNNLTGKTVICGFSPDADISSWIASFVPVGRTFIGILDQDLNGTKEVIYILSGSFTQSTAKSILTSFGCSNNDIIMLDGSKSAQFYMKSPRSKKEYSFQKDARTIPNVLYILHP